MESGNLPRLEATQTAECSFTVASQSSTILKGVYAERLDPDLECAEQEFSNRSAFQYVHALCNKPVIFTGKGGPYRCRHP